MEDIEEVVKYMLQLSDPKYYMVKFMEDYFRAEGTVKEENIKELSKGLVDTMYKTFEIKFKQKFTGYADWREKYENN